MVAMAASPNQQYRRSFERAAEQAAAPRIVRPAIAQGPSRTPVGNRLADGEADQNSEVHRVGARNQPDHAERRLPLVSQQSVDNEPHGVPTNNGVRYCRRWPHPSRSGRRSAIRAIHKPEHRTREATASPVQARSGCRVRKSNRRLHHGHDGERDADGADCAVPS